MIPLYQRDIAVGLVIQIRDLRVYPLDHRPDAVALYCGWTPGKRRALFLPDDWHTASLVAFRGGRFFRACGSNYAMPGPKLRLTIKAGYLNCKIRPYIPNPLRCLKCQRFGHSQTSCRGQLICSRCASAEHCSTDCTLEPKCINCSQSHTPDSKLCPKGKLEKQIQEIKINKNISYFEARTIIGPQLSQTYAQATKPSTVSTTTQTDPNITIIICLPLQCRTPISSTSSSMHAVSTSSQAHLLQ
ncbi:uncharacterized protein TNCV_1150161 [Trichonephila clavipes]|nr:uncharacterized protein TNCV_1150161 [Trichonephila clavipes]